MNMVILKNVLQALTPPVLWRIGKSMCSAEAPAWEYMGTDWSNAENALGHLRGWNQKSAYVSYLERWRQFKVQAANGLFASGPMYHNIDILVFAYSLTLAARNKRNISLLDWGGNLGYFNLFAKAILPDTAIEYHCKDLPMFAEAGKNLQPECCFYSDDSCLNRQYDFILASGSLQYSPDWREVLQALAHAADGYLLASHCFIIEKASSYITLQRAMDTEYLAWCLNRQELLAAAKSNMLALVNEFKEWDDEILPQGAPERYATRGFLLRKDA